MAPLASGSAETKTVNASSLGSLRPSPSRNTRKLHIHVRTDNSSTEITAKLQKMKNFTRANI